jgi:hypothetical protein
MEETVKAWAILDAKTGGLVRYHEDGSYMVEVRKIPRGHLHKTFECVPCTITYQLP